MFGIILNKLNKKFKLLQKIYYRDRSIHVVFSEIWKKNKWAGKESISGPGSSLFQTRVIRQSLPSLLKKYCIHSLLDIPCGDFNWMKTINLKFLKMYIGADIIKELIIDNNNKYKDNKHIFYRLDITKDNLPKVELILLRDCLVHFSFDDIIKTINNIKSSGSKYILTTTFPKTLSNKNIITGYWRQLNLQKPPFSFPKPLFIINEKCTEEDGKYSDKSLGLWKTRDIKKSDIISHFSG